MNITLETDNGIAFSVDDTSYNFSCGPHKMSSSATINSAKALNLARHVGGKVRLSIDGLVTWWGFLTEVSCDNFRCTVNDIKNHLVSTSGPVLFDAPSITNHGVISGSYDNDGTNLSVLSRPVLRAPKHLSLSADEKVDVNIICEGPMARLNRILYVNEDRLSATSGGLIKVGALEVDDTITQQLELPFDSNFLSINYSTEGSPSNATLEVLNAALVPIASAIVTPGSSYASVNYPTVSLGTVFYVRFTYSGADSYSVPLGENQYTPNAAGNASGVLEHPMSMNVRLSASLSVIMNNVSSYIGNIGGLNIIPCTINAVGGTNFVDSAYNKVGDYILNLALLRNMTITFESKQWEYYIWIRDSNGARMSDVRRVYNYVRPMSERSSCSSTSGEDEYQGFIISSWYGTVTYKSKGGSVTYS